jgi:uridine kinase
MQTTDDQILKDVFASTDKSLQSPPVFICFAGIPASGKTTLINKLHEKFGGTVISGDKVCNKYMDEDQKRNNPKGRIPFLFSLLQKGIQKEVYRKNKLMFFDSSIDRSYPIIKKFADSVGFSTYVISIDTPPDIAKKRLIARDTEEKRNSLLSRWEEFQSDHKKFLEIYKPNFSYTDDSQLDALFADLEKFLSEHA